MFRRIILSLSVFLAIAGSSLAAELIEKNDHNNDLMPIDTGKSLWCVQEALSNGFKFDKVNDAAHFIDRCKYLNRALSSVQDSDYEGLAGKMKALLKEPELVKYCAMPEGELVEKFGLLDSKDMGVKVTKKRLQDLVSLGEELEKNADAKLMLGDLYERSKEATGRNLLEPAAEDTTVFFGQQKSSLFGDLNSIYETGCSIDLLKPICKLVRKSQEVGVSALGSDVEDFIEIFMAHDEAKLNKHVELSGVSMDDLKSTCKDIFANFHALKILDSYVSEGFISEQMISEQSKADPNFYLYHQMFKLCKLSTGKD